MKRRGNTTLQRFPTERTPMRPDLVITLPPEHRAMRWRHPMFPNTVVKAEDSPRLLVSGHNSKKLGKVVMRGAWKGFPIYSLTLAERMTCPRSCHVYAECYGNAMHLARRHIAGPTFERKLVDEVCALAKQHRRGFLVRVHTLGDFYSTDYVLLWRAMLDTVKQLHVFGFTACLPDAADAGEREIGQAIERAKQAHPERFRIRWSSRESREDGATVIRRLPERPRVAEGVVCPAETGRTQCCGTCGLCWHKRGDTIVFVLHGYGTQFRSGKASPVRKIDVSEYGDADA